MKNHRQVFAETEQQAAENHLQSYNQSIIYRFIKCKRGRNHKYIELSTTGIAIVS